MTEILELAAPLEKLKIAKNIPIEVTIFESHAKVYFENFSKKYNNFFFL